MSQAESKLSRKIMDELRLEGWFCWKTHGNEFTMKGIPDIIVCAESYFLGLETKMPAERSDVSTDQKRIHAKIKAAGGQAVVVCSPEEAIQVVRAWLAKKLRSC